MRFSVPPLTAIRQPIAAMSAKAVGLLIEGHGRDTGYGPVQTLPFEFVVRESTGALTGKAVHKIALSRSPLRPPLGRRGRVSVGNAPHVERQHIG